MRKYEGFKPTIQSTALARDDIEGLYQGLETIKSDVVVGTLADLKGFPRHNRKALRNYQGLKVAIDGALLKLVIYNVGYLINEKGQEFLKARISNLVHHTRGSDNSPKALSGLVIVWCTSSASGCID